MVLVPVLVAKSLIPKGTPGTTVATKGLYQSTSVPTDSVQPGAISDPNAALRPARGLGYLPWLAADRQQLLGRGVRRLNAQLTGRDRAVTMAIDPVRGSLANVASGDHVDIYTQVNRNGGAVIQLFRSSVLVLQAPGASRRQRRPEGAHR